MQKIFHKIGLVQDAATRAALLAIADELKRIRSVQPVTQDTKSIAAAVNKITGKL